MKKSLFLLLGSMLCTSMLQGGNPPLAMAGGYDTPILYTARHMGMGGAAIGYVHDPSALFHNPAGLSHTDQYGIILNFSPILGEIQASPAERVETLTSERVLAPFFLGGASYRIDDLITLGAGVYPVASSGATYNYTNFRGVDIEDMTRLVFLEYVPSVSFNLPANLHFGAAYRITTVQFERFTTGNNPITEINLSGRNMKGFRFGLQWQPLPWLQAGAVYRHRTVTQVQGDSSIINSFQWGETSMEFILPTKMGVGARADLDDLALAFDVEYGLNSQNDETTIEARNANNPDATPLRLVNQFQWSDSITLRGGAEYRLVGEWRVRGGYVFDGTVSNPQYPSAFGTPPAPTHSMTAGVGTRLPGNLEFNVAYAYRFGNVTVSSEELESREHDCLTCSHPGDYDLSMHGLYVDVSMAF